MKINELSTFSKNRVAKIALGLFATIFVGALGSGLWELVLRDLFFTMGYKTLSLISSFGVAMLTTFIKRLANFGLTP